MSAPNRYSMVAAKLLQYIHQAGTPRLSRSLYDCMVINDKFIFRCHCCVLSHVSSSKSTTNHSEELMSFRGYSFDGIEGVGDLGECGSAVPSGKVLTYARNITNVVTTMTTTLNTTSTVWAVPVNGFIPLQSSTSASTARQTAPSASASTAASQAHTGMATSTKIAIGVGVPLGVLVLASMFALAFFLGSYRRRRRQQPRNMIHEIYPESEGKP